MRRNFCFFFIRMSVVLDTQSFPLFPSNMCATNIRPSRVELSLVAFSLLVRAFWIDTTRRYYSCNDKRIHRFVQHKDLHELQCCTFTPLHRLRGFTEKLHFLLVVLSLGSVTVAVMTSLITHLRFTLWRTYNMTRL